MKSEEALVALREIKKYGIQLLLMMNIYVDVTFHYG